MGLKPAEFISLTYREFVLMCEAFAVKRSHDFEHTRAITAAIFRVNYPHDKPFPALEEFWPLITDDVHKPSQDEEYRYLKEMMEKAKKNKLN